MPHITLRGKLKQENFGPWLGRKQLKRSKMWKNACVIDEKIAKFILSLEYDKVQELKD